MVVFSSLGYDSGAGKGSGSVKVKGATKGKGTTSNVTFLRLHKSPFLTASSFSTIGGYSSKSGSSGSGSGESEGSGGGNFSHECCLNIGLPLKAVN